jgi:polysaccharide deacetylase family protein (PEP-CTERM system associated)
MKNALTFDIEEYFHAEAFAHALRPEEWPGLESRVVDTTERLLDILDYADARATFFVLGWVAERYPSLVKDIAGRGHEIGCHGYGHQMIHRQSRQDFAKDVQRAKTAIEDASGAAVIGYRAPTFSITKNTLWSLEVLWEAGFLYDSSIFPILHDRYGISDAPRFPHRMTIGNGDGKGKGATNGAAPGHSIAEFPLSTLSVLGRRLPIAGGGYFRLVPYQVTRRAIRHLNTKEQQPAIFYLHPWELDVHQPKVRAGWLTHLRHSINIRSTEGKLHRLLKDFRFAPVRDVLAGAGVLTLGTPR